MSIEGCNICASAKDGQVDIGAIEKDCIKRDLCGSLLREKPFYVGMGNVERIGGRGDIDTYSFALVNDERMLVEGKFHIDRIAGAVFIREV